MYNLNFHILKVMFKNKILKIVEILLKKDSVY